MVILLDLWENTKPAAADTATAGEQNNSRQHDEEVIEFDSGSDAEAEVRARQLTTEELGGGYEIVDNTTPAAAAAHLLLLQRPSSHKCRRFPPRPQLHEGFPLHQPRQRRRSHQGGAQHLHLNPADLLRKPRTVHC